VSYFKFQIWHDRGGTRSRTDQKKKEEKPFSPLAAMVFWVLFHSILHTSSPATRQHDLHRTKLQLSEALAQVTSARPYTYTFTIFSLSLSYLLLARTRQGEEKKVIR
jgi:hypothetical protein